MKNPNGPYPGRQIFLGKTAQGNPAFAYLVTGRSPASRARRATIRGNSIIMGPIDSSDYDWLRHYTAIKHDNNIGLLVVSNGIQTEAIFELFRLLYHTATKPDRSYLKKVMDGANYEPDNLETPRIAGVITNPPSSSMPVFLLSIKVARKPAFTWRVKPAAGEFYGISTYEGDIENPKPYNPGKGPSTIMVMASRPKELAETMFELTKEEYKGDDIRVSAIAGIRDDDNVTWKLAHINRHGEKK